MRINTKTIKKVLSNYRFVYHGQDFTFDFSSIIIADLDNKMQAVSNYPPYTSILPICITTTSVDFSKLSKAVLWIVIDDSTTSQIPEVDGPVFLVQDTVTPDCLYHQLTHELFHFHVIDSLYSDALNAMAKNADLNTVLQIFSHYLNAPFTIMSPSRRVLASSFPKDSAKLASLPITENMKKTLEQGYLIEASVDFIKHNANLDVLKAQTPNKVVKISASDNLDILAVDLYVRDHFLGAFTMYGFYRKLTDYDITIMNHLRKLITVLINSNSTIYRRCSAVESYFIFDLITQKLNRSQSLKLAEERGITTRGWLKAFMITKKQQAKAKKIPLLMYISNLEMILGNRFSVIVDDKILIISELGDSPVLSKTKQDNLIRYIQENDLLCLISNPYTDICETRFIWKQLNFLTHECYPLSQDKTLLFFQDHINQWLIHEYTRMFPNHSMHNSGLFLLKQYDQNNDTDYYQTLKTYIKCDCNLTKCANILDIHYNTAKYRMNMIKSISQLKLDTPEEIANITTYLQLSEE